MKCRLLTVVLVFCFISVCSETKAIDPITALGGSGVASDLAGEALPLLTSGTGALLKGSVTIVKDALGVLWLPVGALESTVGAPFGLFGNGITNMVDGVAAPFKVAGDVLALPFQVVGVM